MSVESYGFSASNQYCLRGGGAYISIGVMEKRQELEIDTNVRVFQLLLAGIVAKFCFVLPNRASALL